MMHKREEKTALMSQDERAALSPQTIAAVLSKLKNHFYVYDDECNSLHLRFSVYVDDLGVSIGLSAGRRALDRFPDLPYWLVEETDYSLIPGYCLNRAGEFCLGRDLQQLVRLMPLSTALRMFLQAATDSHPIYPLLRLADLRRLAAGLSTGLQFYHLHIDELVLPDDRKIELRKNILMQLRAYLARNEPQTPGTKV